MSAALAQLIADKNWGYIWPCYALLIATFALLAARAIMRLRHWERRARDAEAK